MINVADKNLNTFCSILSAETGLSFPISRYSFVLNRITPLLKKYNCSTPTELILKCKSDTTIGLDVINALTTNETWFFRHPEHFNILKNNIIPNLLRIKKDKKIRIWSAGCSIGAETYSILFTLLESMPASSKVRIELTGSDISYEAIKIARSGIFTQHDLRDTENSILEKYFEKLDNGNYKVKQELKQYVSFECMNLLETWPPRVFDIIFCRNTMIYFKEDIKSKLINRFFKALDFNGYFITSSNELIKASCEESGIKKLYMNNEMIYQKVNNQPSVSALYFKTPSELLKASNYLRRNNYHFEFGPTENDRSNNGIRALYVRPEDLNLIKECLGIISLVPEKTELIK